jgi:hypothetical protein
MGFPDTFKIPVSDTQAYRQFGNSVAVPATVYQPGIYTDSQSDALTVRHSQSVRHTNSQSYTLTVSQTHRRPVRHTDTQSDTLTASETY